MATRSNNAAGTAPPQPEGTPRLAPHGGVVPPRRPSRVACVGVPCPKAQFAASRPRGVFLGALRILQPDFATGGADATQMIAKWVIRQRRMPELPRDAQNPFLPLANARFERLVELSPGGTLPAPRGGEFVIRTALGSRQILEKHALGRNIVKDFRGIAYQVDAYDVQTTALPGVMGPAFNLGWRVPALSHLPNRALYYSSWK